jgi:chemotaxis protein CheD
VAIQMSETVQAGQMVICNSLATVVTVPNVTSAIIVVLFDTQKKLGGVAHCPLPDSQQDPNPSWQQTSPAKYVDAAIPAMWEQLAKLGATPTTTWAKVVGGAQLFNFAGGAGNALNVGSRNLVMARNGLAQLGIPLDKVDTGGNRAKLCRFTLALGQLVVRKLGEKDEYIL